MTTTERTNDYLVHDQNDQQREQYDTNPSQNRIDHALKYAKSFHALSLFCVLLVKTAKADRVPAQH